VVDPVTAAVDAIVGDLAVPYTLIFQPLHYMGTVFPDVTLAENHTDTSVATQHPVQGGSPISDHYYDNPAVLEVRGGYSDSSGGYPGYVNDMYQAILEQRATREPFTVSTGLRQYDNMLFGQIAVTRDADTDNVLMFSAALTQVTITATGTATSNSNLADPASTSSSANTGNATAQPTSGVQSSVGNETTGQSSVLDNSAVNAASVSPSMGIPTSVAASNTAASGAGYRVTDFGVSLSPK
jgi:hypothetical protein